VVAHRPRDADPAGLGKGLQPCRHIDAVAKDVVALDDDVAEIDANAKPDAALVGYIGLAVNHPALHLGRTAHRVDDTRKFCEQSVAGMFDRAATVLRDLRVYQLVQMRPDAFVRARLVSAHQARIARHIGGEDRGKTADSGHSRRSRLTLSRILENGHRP
jgi:hypothetical protein